MTIINTLIDKEYLNEDEQIQLILYISTNNYNKYNLENTIEVIDAIIEIKNKITVQFNETLTNILNNYIDFLNNCKEQCNIFITQINNEIEEHLEQYKVNPDDIQEVKLIKELYKEIYLLINDLDDKNENIINNLNNEIGDFFIFIIKSIKLLLDKLNENNDELNCEYIKYLNDSLIYTENIKNTNARNLFKIILHKLKNNEEIDDTFKNIFDDLYKIIFDDN